MKFETTEKIEHYLPKVKDFIKDVVMPVEMEILAKEIPEKDRWQPYPELEELKNEAKKRGFWCWYRVAVVTVGCHWTQGSRWWG